MVDYDLVIIGGGAAGLVVASAASQLKAKVALVEKHRLGGDCLWSGCVPSKSLIHVSRIAQTIRESQGFGITAAGHVEINLTQVIDYLQRVIATIEPHDSPERFTKLGVEVIFGSGKFLNPRTFLVNQRQLTARAFVIATGSRAAVPDIPGLAEAGYFTNEDIFTLTTPIASLGIIGGGPIGCELGQALQRLGVQVTLIETSAQLLTKEEPEIAAVLETQLRQEGLTILKQTQVKQVKVVEGKKQLVTTAGTITVEAILVATGRVPNLESLDLASAGVEFNRDGIKVNEKLQTTNPKIYACGDVIGGYRFTHVASLEATVVLKNALFLPVSKINYRIIPWATFTDPEIARVGLGEQQARQLYGDDLCILKHPFTEVDRAQTEGYTLGFAKIITRANGEILGAHLVGPHAGELIPEIVLAMSRKLKISALSGIHIYPTLAEINSKVALRFTKEKYAANSLLQKFLASLFSWLRRWS